MHTTLLFTPLPCSRADEHGFTDLKLSVFVSPRLGTAADPVGSLDDYPVFDVPWPGTAVNLRPRVQILTTAGVQQFDGAATIVNQGDEALDAGLWSDLFPSTTSVRPFGYQSYSQDGVQSFAVARNVSFLQDLYRDVALDPNTVDQGRHWIGGHPFLYLAVGRIRHTVHEHPTDAADVILKRVLDEANLPTDVGAITPEQEQGLFDLISLYQFYARDRGLTPDTSTPPAIDVWKPDFHEMVATLGDAPILLRRLGLILDLEVQVRSSLLPSVGIVRVSTAATLPSSTLAFPHTVFETAPEGTSPGYFRTRPGNASWFTGGHLVMGTDFEPFQFDVDGAGLKLVNHTANVNQHSVRFADVINRPPDQQSTLPANQEAGIAVSHTDRTEAMYKAWDNQDTLDGALTSGDLADSPLALEDVLRGFRVDVLDRGKWRSLCAREVRYVARGAALGPFSDEGYVKGGSMVHDAYEDTNHYMHERLFEWSGWSLVAARPGLVLTPEETLAKPENPAATELDLETHTVAEPGTLPRLRFGQSYQMKARAVDLAGNSVSLEEAGTSPPTSGDLSYFRHAPVPSPTLVYRDPISEGEWIENLVIRSDRDVSVADYADAEGYNETCERHVAPPKANLQCCEHHGVFDDANFFVDRWGTDAATQVGSYAIAAKEGGTFLDDRVWRSDTQSFTNVTLSFWAHPDTPIADPRAQRGDPLGEGVYVTHPDAKAQLPYLADPAAQGVLLLETDGPATSAARWSKDFVDPDELGARWPEVSPFRLVCLEHAGGSTDPEVVVTSEGVEVRLPKATIYELEMCTLLRQRLLPHFALYQQFEIGSDVRSAALNSLHPMLSPRRTVTFVHAVQRPLEAPQTDAVEDEERARGQTWSSLLGAIEVHGRSTAQLDVYAQWTEYDDVSDPDGLRLVPRTVHLTEIEIDYDQEQVILDDLSVRQEFGDTKHRNVQYYAKATTRYREYLPERIWRHEENITEIELAGPSTRAFCTVRPGPPDVRMIVPSMRWTRSEPELTAPTNYSVTRAGNRLRVVLERPWFTTGEDEQLGVLFGRNNNDVRSEWGADPIRENDSPTNALAVEDLVNADQVIAAEDVSGSLVDVALFDVEFSEELGAHFVDIELRPNLQQQLPYMPFVRLVLARVQRFAAIDTGDDIRVSREVRSEWVQTMPTREATIVGVRRGGSDRLSIEVSGTAGGPNVDALRASRHAWFARIERNREGASDLGWETTTRTVELTPEPSGSVQVWRGEMRRGNATAGGPDLRASGGEVYRVSVYEIERFASDEETAGPVSGFNVGQPPIGSLVEYTTGTGASGRVVTVLHLPVVRPPLGFENS